jgi:hypothetical protein
LAGRGELHALLRRLDPERELTQPLREEEAGRPDFVWLESTELTTRPALDLAQRRQVQDFIGDVLKAAESLRQEAQPAEALQEVMSRRPEHRLLAPRLDKLSQEEWLALLDEAESHALDLLLGEEE